MGGTALSLGVAETLVEFAFATVIALPEHVADASAEDVLA
jgi:hypothetical protein